MRKLEGLIGRESHTEQLYFRQGHMIEASGLWVDPVLKNMWADLKWLIQNDFRESLAMWEKKSYHDNWKTFIQ